LYLRQHTSSHYPRLMSTGEDRNKDEV